MKRISLFVFIGASVVAFMMSQVRADTAATYQVREVVHCPSISHPPDAQEATVLLTCNKDSNNFAHGTAYRSVVSGVQVAAPRAYTYGDPGGDEINPSAAVYPIRGQSIDYVCAPVSDYMQNAGKNCSAYTYSGLGICYQTPFNDWKCVLNGTRTNTQDGIAGPQ